MLLLRSLAYTHVAERGGFEPPVLFWSTHDFQSCTFNRSVTSPFWNFKYLAALPNYFSSQCLQNVSTRDFCEFESYHKELARAKPNCHIDRSLHKKAGNRPMLAIASFGHLQTLRTCGRWLFARAAPEALTENEQPSCHHTFKHRYPSTRG